MIITGPSWIVCNKSWATLNDSLKCEIHFSRLKKNLTSNGSKRRVRVLTYTKSLRSDGCLSNRLLASQISAKSKKFFESLSQLLITSSWRSALYLHPSSPLEECAVGLFPKYYEFCMSKLLAAWFIANLKQLIDLVSYKTDNPLKMNFT